MKTTRLLGITALALSILTLSSFGQAQTPAGGGNRPTQANIEEFRKRAAERIKTAFKATDEEWTVLQPLIENVQTKQRDTFSGRYGGFGRTRGGDNNTTSTEPARPGQAEAQALQSTLENESSSVDEVKAKLAAVRDSRKKAQAALTQAREELRKVLTVRQEAAAVSLGLLE